MSEFVLVHGAMHGSWCWKPVAEHLDDVSSVIVENAIDRKRSRLYALRSAGHRRNT
ncbi:MAG: hypothetical protein K0U31_09060 [Actinomycetia bacterium]|nr:hypothetical protein [Actinomycetes bacterium]